MLVRSVVARIDGLRAEEACGIIYNLMKAIDNKVEAMSCSSKMYVIEVINFVSLIVLLLLIMIFGCCFMYFVTPRSRSRILIYFIKCH
jgi:hypothetical protein